MSDLIDRQDVLELPRNVTRNLFGDIVDESIDVERIKALPSAEPEIIRCKDCRFAHLTYDGDCKYCDKWTDEFGILEELYLDGDFFCGYAERRTE